MAKNITIAILLIVSIWLGAAVVRLENYHYASVVGMCGEFKPDDPSQTVPRHNCLHRTETRTRALWHLYYGLKGE